MIDAPAALGGKADIERDGNKPFHTVINAENSLALKTLTYTHRGQIDAIHIDPPDNTRVKDWKYNNPLVIPPPLAEWVLNQERAIQPLMNANGRESLAA